MIAISYRARQAVAPSLLAAAVCFISSCSHLKDQLLDPQQPGVIGPSSVGSAIGADALVVGALQSLSSATGGSTSMWSAGGTLTDEWMSGDTFFQTDDKDRRAVPAGSSSTSPWPQQTRGYAIDAINALKQYEPTATAKIAQMYFVEGWIEMDISEHFCNGSPFGTTVNGVPQYTKQLTNVEAYTMALAHFDSALTAVGTASDAFSVSVRNSILVAKARTQRDLAQFAAAATTVATVPTNFAWNLTFSITTGDNGPYGMNAPTANPRYVVGDSFDVVNGVKTLLKNALPFASANDPRVPVVGKTDATSPKAADGITTLVYTQVWGLNRSAAVPLVTGIDARLIEAEGKLQANDIPGMMSILNALRASPQQLGSLVVPVMPPLASPTTRDGAIDLLFRETAFWQFGRGTRLGNLRRLIRQYGRAQENVFPDGPFHKGGVHGTDVNFSIPDAEFTNPNYTGCLDRKA
jgi:starch-binding outer membrane protein, SusD/RagB family